MGLEQKRDSEKYTPQEKRDLTEQRNRYEKRAGYPREGADRSPETTRDKILYDALIEKYMRKELEYRDIKMSEADFSKMLHTGSPEFGVATIDSNVHYNPRGVGDEYLYSNVKTGEKRSLSDNEKTEFLKRYPLEKLYEAWREALKKVKAEYERNEAEFDAKSTIDNL